MVGCGVGEPRHGRGLAEIMKEKDLWGEAQKEKPQRSSGPGACGCNSSPAKQLQGRLRSSHTVLPHLLSQTSPTKAAFPTIASPTLEHCQICAWHSTRSWPAPPVPQLAPSCSFAAATSPRGRGAGNCTAVPACQLSLSPRVFRSLHCCLRVSDLCKPNTHMQ